MAAVFPGGDVMDLAVVEAAIAFGPGTTGVEGSEGDALGVGRGPVAATDRQGQALAVSDDVLDDGVAAQSGEGGG